MNTLSHSPSAYIAALMWRSKRTLMVEGIDDRKVIYRLIFELAGSSPDTKQVVVDIAEQVRAPLGITGRRATVEHVHNLASSAGAPLGGLVDREFRDFQLSPTIADTHRQHKVVNSTLFWTRGHSIENYFFTPEIFIRYLRFRFAEHLPANFEDAIRTSFRHLLEIACAVSSAALQSGLIERMNDFLSIQHWTPAPNSPPELDLTAVSRALETRGGNPSNIHSFRNTFSTELKNAKSVSTSELRWFLHGHIGSRVFWSGFARILRDQGLHNGQAEQIGHGDWEVKLRVSSEAWAADCANSLVDTPSALLEWLKLPPPTKAPTARGV